MITKAPPDLAWLEGARIWDVPTMKDHFDEIDVICRISRMPTTRGQGWGVVLWRGHILTVCKDGRRRSYAVTDLEGNWHWFVNIMHAFSWAALEGTPAERRVYGGKTLRELAAANS